MKLKKTWKGSLDEQRANISIESVNEYIKQVEGIMADLPHPFLLINFDEIGFCRRPQRNKCKNFYVIKGCSIIPFCLERIDQYHISVVVAVSAACCNVTPLFLSPRKRLADIKDIIYQLNSDEKFFYLK